MPISRTIARLRTSIAGAVRSFLTTRFVLIVPSDPWTLTGSIGDAAMLTAVIARMRSRREALEIRILTATDEADSAATQLGAVPWRVNWGSERFLIAMEQAFTADRIEAVIVLGADVMDGGYNPDTTRRLLRLTDLAASRGIRSVILGFSFNRTPSPDLRADWAGLHPDVAINVRDRRSLERFEAFSDRQGTLVADCAFLLEPRPGPASAAVAAWASGQRQRGRRVLGLNFHPQLFKGDDVAAYGRLSDAFRRAIDALSEGHDLSFVVIPHDRRTGSDSAALEAFCANLPPVRQEQVLFMGEPIGPDEIKSLASHLDGVVTGRMHLAIAALGAGTPIAALTYQDKFEGLLDHFALPDWLLMTPEAASDPDELRARLLRFTDALDELAVQVRVRLPDVEQAASRNLASLEN
jgi:polysaccharide pyruvyl transferase WcaK-like protein